MASGAHTTNNGDLAFVARCSVPDLFVASASYDLWCTMIQWHVSFVDIIDSVRRLHQIILNKRVCQQVEVLNYPWSLCLSSPFSCYDGRVVTAVS